MPLISYFPLTEDSGSTVYDYSGNGNDGTITGTPTQGATGILGSSAYTFNGDSIDVGGTYSSPTFSLAAWVKTSNADGTEDTLFRFDDATAIPRVGTNNGQVWFNQVGSSDVTGSSIADGAWHHVYWSYDGSTVQIYIDGELDVSASRSYTSGSGSDGRLGLGWIGEAAEVRIYDHILTKGEIQYLYDTAVDGDFTTSRFRSEDALVPDVGQLDFNTSGEGAEMNVIGDPGKYDEERRRVTLNDGDLSKDLSWLNSHTEFEIAVSTGPITDPESEISFNRIALSDDVRDSREGVVDSFEDRNLDEWQNVDDGNYEITSEDSIDGDWSLKNEYTGDYTNYAFSTGGLDRYPQAGDKFVCYVKETEDNQNPGPMFGLQDNDNHYFVTLNTDTRNSETVALFRQDAGSNTQLSSASNGSVTLGEWNRVEVDWGEGGEIVVDVYDENNDNLASISATDATYTSGGAGFRSNATNETNDTGTRTVYFDGFEITSTTAGTGVIDDFEDGDLSEYADTSTGGNINIVTSPVFEGTYALEMEETSGGNGSFTSLSGLPRYPQAGDTFQYRHRVSDFSNTYRGTFRWAVNEEDRDPSEGYSATLNGDGLDTSFGNDTSWTPQTGVWYRIVVDWGRDGSTTITVYDESDTQVSQVSGVDSSYKGGGINGRGSRSSNSNQKSYFDLAEITQSGDQLQAGTVDDFEDGNLDEYTQVGDGSINITTGTVHSGTNALEVVTNINSSRAYSDAGLDRYPSAGDVFEYWINYSDITQSGQMWFGSQSSSVDNAYQVLLNSSALQLREVSGGGASVIADDSSVSVSSNQWYRIKVRWDGDGDITIRLYNDTDTELSKISANSTLYSSGGIGFGGSSNNSPSWFFDDIEILER